MTDGNTTKSPSTKIAGLLIALALAAGAYYFFVYNAPEEVVLSEDEVIEAEAPAPHGEPALIVYFDPKDAEKTSLDRAEVPPGDRAAITAIADKTRNESGKRILITAYYNEVLDPNNNIEYARLRAKAVRFFITGEGLPNERVLRGKPVALSDGSARDANRVEVRLQ